MNERAEVASDALGWCLLAKPYRKSDLARMIRLALDS